MLVSRPSAFGPLSPPLTNDSTVSEVGQGGAHRLRRRQPPLRRIRVRGRRPFGRRRRQVVNVYVRDRTLGVTILVSRADGPARRRREQRLHLTVDQRRRTLGGVPERRDEPRARRQRRRGARLRARPVSGTTRLVDRADGADGAIANDSSFDPAITVVGGQPVVAFTSVANNLDGATAASPRSTSATRAGDTTMVSRPNGSIRRGQRELEQPVDLDERRASWRSSPPPRTSSPATTTANDDVFIRTLASSATLIAASRAGNGDSRNPSISGGRRLRSRSPRRRPTSRRRHEPGRTSTRASSPRDPEVLVSRADGVNGGRGNKPSSQPSINDGGNVDRVHLGGPTTSRPGDTNAIRGRVPLAVRLTSHRRADQPPAETGTESDGPSTSPSISRNASNGTQPDRLRDGAPTTWAPTTRTTSRRCTARLSGIVRPAPNPATYLSRPDGADPFRSGVNVSYLRAPHALERDRRLDEPGRALHGLPLAPRTSCRRTTTTASSTSSAATT